MQRRKLYLIKFGGSLITSKKSGVPLFDSATILRLGKEIKENLPADSALIIGHGAGSFGHPAAMRFLNDLPHLSPDQIQERLKAIRAEVRILAQEVKSCLSGFFDINLVNAKDVISVLRDGRIPLIHGDVNFDGPPYIISTEDQFLQIAESIHKDYDINVIMASDSAVLNPDGTPYITLTSAALQNFAEDSMDATGGMHHKIETGLKLKKYADEVLILNGNTKNNLASCISGDIKCCTKINI